MFVILHGVFGAGGNWRSIAHALAGHYRVLNVDLRNHGESPRHPSMTYPEMAEDLKTTLPVTDPIVLLGHSMGGKVAMTFALHYPERVDALIVVDIAPVAYSNRLTPICHALNTLPLDQLHSRQEADQILARSLADLTLRQFLLQNLRREHGRFCWRVDLAAVCNNLEQIAGFPDFTGRCFDKPVLFCLGEQSAYVRAEHAEATLQLFPRARFRTIPRAGHWPHVENTAVFWGELQNFLRGSD